MDLKTLNSAIERVAGEKGIDAGEVLNAVETAIAAAYKKEYRKKSEIVKSKFDLKTGKLQFWQAKTVVDPEKMRFVEDENEPVVEVDPKEDGLLRFNSDRHILLADAKVIKADAEVGEEINFPLESHSDFGRIAAQTAKQVVLQVLREAERSSVKKEFSDKEDQIVSGTVQRFERGNVYIDLGRAMGIMFHNESIPGEHYRIGERMRFYVAAVQDEYGRQPGIILSRAHPKFIMKLFEMEVPEIADGAVEIKLLAREPGSRTKVAFASKVEGVDPVGSAVGQRGTRVMAVTNELGNEKIDIIEWSEDPEKFIANSLSPAKVKEVEVLPRREARVFVQEDQLSLAIGKGGQNVRLAAKLTGWKIDVRSQARPDEVQEGGVAEAEAAAAQAKESAAEED